MLAPVDSIWMPRAWCHDERLDRLAFLPTILTDVFALVRTLVDTVPTFVDTIRMTRTHRRDERRHARPLLSAIDTGKLFGRHPLEERVFPLVHPRRMPRARRRNKRLNALPLLSAVLARHLGAGGQHQEYHAYNNLYTYHLSHISVFCVEKSHAKFNIPTTASSRSTLLYC